MDPIRQVVETAAYVEDLDAAVAFYRDILGLRLMSFEPPRHAFFQVGDGVLLLFRTEETLKGDMLPSHGTKGAGHFALGITPESLDAWRQHLRSHGVAIEQEMTWPRGGKSLYFRDPAGNALELVTPGIWGLPSGW